MLPPVIVVLPNGMVDSFYRDAADGQRPVESVIIKELIPHVDQTYRTIAAAKGRIIQGYSMGGYGAAHLGFKYPELFGTVVIDAGALDAHRFRQVDEAIDHPNELVTKNARNAPPANAHSHRRRRSADYLHPANQELHELLDRLHIAHDYEVVPAVKHSGASYYKRLGPHGFDFHGKALQGSATSRTDSFRSRQPVARNSFRSGRCWTNNERNEFRSTTAMIPTPANTAAGRRSCRTPAGRA